MRLLLTVLVTVLAVAHSSHRRYRSPGALYHPHAGKLGHPPVSFTPCRNGLAPRSDGSCVYPKVSKDVYFFNAPKFEAPFSPPLYEPQPKIHYNYVFVKTADKNKAHRPVIVPPAKQKTVVYLLSENPGAGKQEVIEVPFQPTKPEVHFVGYSDGDNPSLPGGIDLRTALSHADGLGHASHLGSSFAEHGSGGSFFESGNSLDSFGGALHGFGEEHGFGGHHGLSGQLNHGLSGHSGVSGQYGLSAHHGLNDHHGLSDHLGLSDHHGFADHHGASDLHGLSQHPGIPTHYDVVGPEGITELAGVHYGDGSLLGRGVGAGVVGGFSDRFHRDVRQSPSSGRDQSSTGSSATSSSGTSRGITSSGTSRATSTSRISSGSRPSGESRGSSSSKTSRVSHSTRFVPSPRVEYD